MKFAPFIDRHIRTSFTSVIVYIKMNILCYIVFKFYVFVLVDAKVVHSTC